MRYVAIDCNLDDVLDQLDPDDKQYVADRLGSVAARETVRDVIAMIRRGALDDAILTLEREFLPKWESSDVCAAHYAMNPNMVGGLSDHFAKALVMRGAA